MMRHFCLAALALLVPLAHARAVIDNPIPLKDAIADVAVIVLAEVTEASPDKPLLVLKVGEALKGKAPPERMAIVMKGDAEAARKKQVPELFARLTVGRKLVLMMSTKEKTTTGLFFVEGTWFQVQGVEDGEAVRWALLHHEPYLRRTFAGTTAELAEHIKKAVAGTATPPGLNAKEVPGYGPLPEKDAKPETPAPAKKEPMATGDRAAAASGRLTSTPSLTPPALFLSPPPLRGRVREGGGSRSTGNPEPLETSSCSAHGERPPSLTLPLGGGRGQDEAAAAQRKPVASATLSPAPFAVIPSFALLGPLALLAAFFPGVFARLAVAQARWRVLLIVASVTSTLSVVYYFLASSLPDSPWLAPPSFTGLLVAVTLVGVLVAAARHRASDEVPARGEVLTLSIMSGLLLAFVVGVGLFAGWGEAVHVPFREFTVLTGGLTVAAVYAASRRLAGTGLKLSGETVGLGAMAALGVALLVGEWPRGGTATNLGEVQKGDATEDASAAVKLVDCQLLWESGEADQVQSGVCVTPELLCFGTGKTSFINSSGSIVALDRGTGGVKWTFSDGGQLKPVFATPAVAGGKLYAGEGLHKDSDRRLFCLDLATGKPAWPEPFVTQSHTEGTPLVRDGRVYFPAGDDGFYCVDAATGKKVWHKDGGEEAKLHVDTPAAMRDGRVYVGSGYRGLTLLALDAKTGTDIWRKPAAARSFGRPLCIGSAVYFGLGTGNLIADLSTEPEEGVPTETTPRGLVVAHDAATGEQLWQAELPRSVHTPLAGDAASVFAAAKDGVVYCFDRKTGKLRWKRPCAAIFTSGPALASYAGGSFSLALYAVSAEGLVVCLDPRDGKLLWSRDLAAQVGRQVEVISTPVVVEAGADGVRREVYLGAKLTTRTGSKAAAVFKVTDAAGE